MFTKEIVAAMYRKVKEAAAKNAPIVSKEISEARELCNVLAQEYAHNGVSVPVGTAHLIFMQILTLYGYTHN